MYYYTINSHFYENTKYNNQLFAIPLRFIANNARGYLRRHTPFRFAELRITADIQNFFSQTLRDLLQETSDHPRALSEINLFFVLYNQD